MREGLEGVRWLDVNQQSAGRSHRVSEGEGGGSCGGRTTDGVGQTSAGRFWCQVLHQRPVRGSEGVEFGWTRGLEGDANSRPDGERADDTCVRTFNTDFTKFTCCSSAAACVRMMLYEQHGGPRICCSCARVVVV